MASFSVLLILACTILASDAAAAVRVGLTRIHADPEVTASEFVRGALRRDMHRHARFAREQLAPSSAAAAGLTVGAPTQKDLRNGGEYIMTLSIGTPPLSYRAIADTGSDLIWTQCAPCGDTVTDTDNQCFKQSGCLYNPSSSTTFGVLPCNSPLSMCAAMAGPSPPPGCACMYNQTYGTGWTAGVQSVETFTFGSSSTPPAVRVPNIAFGCSNASSNDWNGSAGLVGLGRGSMSLVSQLGAGAFSYCLTPFQDANSTSTLLLGPSAAAALKGTGPVRSTPFVAGPSKAPMSTYYYLNLTGISVGETALAIPPDAFSLRADGTGGLIIDSGTTITTLVDSAYQQVRAAVRSLLVTRLPLAHGPDHSTGLDLCFALKASTPPPAMPSMTLHFEGGADMVLPVENYMILGSGVWCLAMRNQTVGAMSMVGNYQQQNIHVLYDVRKETLSFAPAVCSSL
ncbi:aspartic proteinase nepenthesin-1 [Brachypodium distachyon]|uniref:Peptidase A1 domain-containing protein n=1 Tax=Brachypodium distachyon TaxID=15368 RepID=I1GTT1_BRADI|nr:aspartic proteinase nepenthesin-1 [Brachypodium distachyon]KQK15916.1 hypothetical protein BRADI_1g25770v3 [Brachypodium distachyon]|eukprot:XP_003562987.1 aspartic proteinase nepenthesin-1 [Brachypodium distachyon]